MGFGNCENHIAFLEGMVDAESPPSFCVSQEHHIFSVSLVAFFDRCQTLDGFLIGMTSPTRDTRIAFLQPPVPR